MASKNLQPTEYRACSGQGWNQSMTVQLTRAGKRWHLVEKSGPTGEQHRQTCRFRRTSWRKKS